MKFSDIPQFIHGGNYKSTQEWRMLPKIIKDWETEELAPLDIDPDFQRGHVWTIGQKISYIEYKLKGGQGSDIILFNCPGWMDNWKGPFQLVDGKQRLNAVLLFLNNEIPVFGNNYYSNFEDRLFNVHFTFHINNLKTRKEVLQWYIELNTGGTVHTEEEINKVRSMLEEAK